MLCFFRNHFDNNSISLFRLFLALSLLQQLPIDAFPRQQPHAETETRRQQQLRGLAISSPLTGFASGTGSGQAFGFSRVSARGDSLGGRSTSTGVSAGGGSGFGEGYVETNIGSAYGGGTGGGNVSTIESEYGNTKGADTYAYRSNTNSSVSGYSAGSGQGRGIFGGLFNFTPTVAYSNNPNKQPVKYGSFGNATGGGGSGYGYTYVETKGYAGTPPDRVGRPAYGGATGSINSAASGYGYGGGTIPSDNGKTISAGGSGGGNVFAEALGYTGAGAGVSEDSDGRFNATGDGFADGGAFGYIGDADAVADNNDDAANANDAGNTP